MKSASETPSNLALWNECSEQVKTAHPAADGQYIDELTAKSYEYQFLERLCDGEPYTIDNTKDIEEYFKRKFNE